MSAPLPVITTPLLERRERAYLAWIAIANEVADIPLESPPIDGSTHALEIHAKGFEQPLVLLADPTGAPTKEGFPLRLSPLDETQAATLRAELFTSAGTNSAAPPADKPVAAAPPQVRDLEADSSSVTQSEPRVRASIPPLELTEHHAMALTKQTGAGAPPRREPGSLKGRTLGDGRFRLDKLLGAGASGEVYRAVHTALRRSVAVKVLHPTLALNQDYCTRFYIEALAASQLDHRNVSRVIDYGQEPDGLLYIVMELLEGKSLEQLLQVEKPMSEARIVEIVAQACAGLAHAHDAGVIHRDIKPENIVVVKGRDDDGREADVVKVCDFGIAHWTAPASKEVGDEDHTLSTTPDASRIVGTPIYMSPEQIENESVDARSDVYSLGVVLYELATGRVPFTSDDAMEVLRAHMIIPPDPPSQHRPDLSTELERVILKALEKDPAARHRNTRELRTALRRIVNEDWSSQSGLFRRAVPRAALTADDFVTKTADALGTLHDIAESERAGSYAGLTEALKSSLVEGRLKLARDLVDWLKIRLADHGLPEPERNLAQRALNIVRDPDVARAHAIHLLDGTVERSAEALAMLSAAGPLAAAALIDVRRTRPPSLELRAHFVATLRALGAPALGAIISALEPLTSLASRTDEALAEDLLRAIPDERSDAGGEIAVRFVRLDKPALGVAALRATATFWNLRARPLLIGVLDAEHDGLRMVALEELKRLGCVDDAVIERLGRILGQGLAGDELKLAAAAAFASAMPEARPRAISFLGARLAPPQRLMSSIRSALGQREDVRITAALARSLHTLEPQGSHIVLERLANARPELRPQIDAILGGR